VGIILIESVGVQVFNARPFEIAFLKISIGSFDVTFEFGFRGAPREEDQGENGENEWSWTHDEISGY
jgi:hypothetical protein